MAKQSSPSVAESSVKRVKFKTSVVSNVRSHINGEVVDLPTLLADTWIKADICDPAPDEKLSYEPAKAEAAKPPSAPAVAPVTPSSKQEASATPREPVAPKAPKAKPAKSVKPAKAE